MEQTNIINIPVSWQDVKLEQGKQIFLIDKTILSGSAYVETVYEILSGEEFNNIPLDQVSEIENRIHQLLSSKIENKLKYRFLIQGEFYYLQYDLTKSIWGQWKDWEQIVQSNKLEGNIWNVIEQLLVILLRPAKDIKQVNYSKKKHNKDQDNLVVESIELEDYNPNLTNPRQELFLKHLTIGDVYPIALFFYLSGIQYINTLLISLSPVQSTLNTPTHSAHI